jgi:chemotaxis signal transduction protein
MTAYCVFNVGARRIGIPMTDVREVIDQRLIVPTPIPLMPAFVRGLFNLRGQIIPYLDLAPFLGADSTSTVAAIRRAVIVERGNFRFAMVGDEFDTVTADPATFQAPADAALYPALDMEARTRRGTFVILHLDRLEACLAQTLKYTETMAVTA